MNKTESRLNPVILPVGNSDYFLCDVCGIISKIKVLHLKIKVYMKNIAVFTH